MQVIKRSGRSEVFDSEKIYWRIQKCAEFHPSIAHNVNVRKVTDMTVKGVMSGIHTFNIDELATENAASLIIEHSDYSKLATRLIISNLHKETPGRFSTTCKLLREHSKTEGNVRLINEDFYRLVMRHRDDYDRMVIDERDYDFDYFGYKTLEKTYLKRIEGKICDRPQYMFLRVAIALYGENLEAVRNCYLSFAYQFITHATPTLQNAGSCRQQYASCFLMQYPKDSLDSICDVNKQKAMISQSGGGIGCAISKLRSRNSLIKSTGGTSKGPCGFLEIANKYMAIVDQGGKRPGADAIYIEPWHEDIEQFLDLKTNTGDVTHKTYDLFQALWMPNLFFKMLIENENQDWYLFCPTKAPGLDDVYGDEFENLYWRYVKEGRYSSTIRINKLMDKIANTVLLTGGPYCLLKDEINIRNNQKNLGTIHSSNLCAEIVQYTAKDEISVCTLASLSLPKFIREEGSPSIDYTNPQSFLSCSYLTNITNTTGTKPSLASSTSSLSSSNTNILNMSVNPSKVEVEEEEKKNIPKQTRKKLFFDFDLLFTLTKMAIRNLDRVLDVNEYPKVGKYKFDPNCPPKYKKFVNYAKKSSIDHRAIGLGVQGLARVFFMLKIPFDSKEARILNRQIFETIYFAAMTASCELAKEYGPYSSFQGSPLSQGKFQFDLCDIKPFFKKWDWETLRKDIMKYGVRNSLTVALMPTKSTSHILGNVECFEPINSNVFKARVLSGEFTLVNPHLVEDLSALNLWNQDMVDLLVSERGSIQNIQIIPQEIRDIYKTSYEVDWKVLQDLAADRAPFVDQTQSLNYFLKTPTLETIIAIWLRGYQKKLKTVQYYVYALPPSNALQYTLTPERKKELEEKYLKPYQNVKLVEVPDVTFRNRSITFNEQYQVTSGLNNRNLQEIQPLIRTHSDSNNNNNNNNNNIREDPEEDVICSLNKNGGPNCKACSS